jgi:phage terminase large subunit
MGTPRGFNHFYDLINFAKDDKRWFYLEATWRDSPYVKKEFIEEERAEAEKKGTLSTFLQEVELEFRAVQGAVYPSFNRNVHIVKPMDVPQDLTIYGAMDFGWHTTAFLFVGIDKDKNWWIFDEVYGKEEILRDILPRIKDRAGDKRLTLIVADSANRDAIETMQADGFPVVGISKNTKSITHGINLINEKLKPRIQLVGKPKPTVFISSVCKNLIFEMEAYKYPEEKKDRNPSDEPVKENDHGPDALRYLVLHLKYNMNQAKVPIKTGLNFNEYGL